MSKIKFDKYKHVLLITDVNFPYGGASANFLRLFTKGLAENDYDVRVILQKGNQYGNHKAQQRKGIINNVKYVHCCYANRPKNYLLKIIDDICGIVFPLFFIIKYSLLGRLDCIVMYNSNAVFSVLNLLTNKILGFPIFNFVVEWYEKASINSKSALKQIKWAFFNFQFFYLNNKFSGLIVLSNFLKNYYLKSGLKENKILIQPNFVDFKNFENIKTSHKNNIKRIGYCGTPTRKDGIDDLLSAFQLLQISHKNTELLVIGDWVGAKSLLPKLKEQAQSKDIYEKVIFTGLVDFTKIPTLLHSCDILVLARPSGIFAEAGFPTKLGEYMACKKPVVITKVGDIPLYLRDGESAMLAEPDNPQSVADKIAYLIENPEKAKEIGEFGYIWAKNTLEYKNAAKNIIEFIEKFGKE